MKPQTRQLLLAGGFLLPNLLGFACFTFMPVVASLVISFCHWNLLNGIDDLWFAGLENFKAVFADSLFWKYFANTLVLITAVPLAMATSLLLAVLLNRPSVRVIFFRTLFFLPTICAGVALYLLWKWIYDPSFGPLNGLIRGIGDMLGQNWEGPRWLASTDAAKPALILMNIWIAMGGYNLVLYLAGLQSISPELYEAAQIEGAGKWRQFWSITFPLLSPTTFFIFVTNLIGGLQGGFDQAYVMTQGGPAGSTKTIAYYIFENAFELQQMGKAAAIAWILFLIVAGITMANWRLGSRRVEYGD
jgi:multiple sugar transport system permease protein